MTSISRVRPLLASAAIRQACLRVADPARLPFVPLSCYSITGACEGSIACSTCHIVLSQEMYDALPEPSDEENDMLDLAFGLTDT